jgi:hypothetical protein
MNFASFSKVALLSVLAGMVALSGCGASNNLTLPAGNWSMTAAPNGTVANNNFYIGGNLTQSGTSLTGTMSVIGSLSCFAPSQIIPFTGTVKGTNVTLTSASVGGEVITIAATGTNGSLAGTYSIAGGTSCNGQTGTIAANPVPAISATWNGPVGSGTNVTLAIAFTEAVTPSSDGTFALTGGLTFTGSTCSTGVIPANSSFIVGPYLVVNGYTDDGSGSFSYTALLNNPASLTSMTGELVTSNGNCDGDLLATLTKQ